MNTRTTAVRNKKNDKVKPLLSGENIYSATYLNSSCAQQLCVHEAAQWDTGTADF